VAGGARLAQAVRRIGGTVLSRDLHAASDSVALSRAARGCAAEPGRWRSARTDGDDMSDALISPQLRARLRDLRLTPRRAAGAHGLGQHSSRSRGTGLEFAQYRAYAPGDEPRRVDWKLYARSDRYFVRESERDSPLDLWLLVDVTASMAQADEARPQYARLDAARTLAACAIELALRQGDRFGLAALSTQPPAVLAAAGGARQRDRCVQELLRWHAHGQWPDQAQLLPLWERIAPASLVLLISDGFPDPDWSSA